MYHVLHGETCIGDTELERSDPDTGIVGGAFFPTEGYIHVRPLYQLFSGVIDEATERRRAELLAGSYWGRDALYPTIRDDENAPAYIQWVHIVEPASREHSCDITFKLSDESAQSFFERRAAPHHGHAKQPLSPDAFVNVAGALAASGQQYGPNDFNGKWQDKHWMNTPGAIYTGETDNCGTGPMYAPNNVGFDEDGYEVIFRLPMNAYQRQQTLLAGRYNPFGGYAADGDSHWTYATVKAWWRERQRLEEELLRLAALERVAKRRDIPGLVGVSEWLRYLREGMYTYLRAYAFLLDNGRSPEANVQLPEL